MNSQVRQLDLYLSLPQALQSDSWSIAQELRHGFVCRVVETIEAKLHAQFGSDAIIEVPNLSVSWSGEEEVFANTDYARQVGEEMAHDILSTAESVLDQELFNPLNGDTIRIFKNEVHRIATTIVGLAQEQERVSAVETVDKLERGWRRLCDLGSDEVLECVDCIAEISEPSEVAESIPTPLLRVLIETLPLKRWPKKLRAVIKKRLRAEATGITKTENVESLHLQGASKSAAGASQSEGTPSTPSERFAHKSAATKWLMRADEQQLESPGVYRVESASDTIQPDLTTPTQLKPIEQTEVLSEHRAPTDEPIVPTDSRAVRDDSGAVVPVEDAHIELLSTHVTHFAGLVYLLNLINRVELPEILWCCAIDERSFLFDLCTKFVGHVGRGDPLINAISGIAQDNSNFVSSVIPQWAWDEVLQKVDRSIRERLRATNEPEALYPGVSREIFAQLASGYQQAEESWPSLVKYVARLMECAFTDVVGIHETGVLETSCVSLDGYIQEYDDSITVRVPMELVNFDVRRATLDANPGFLAWQGKSLTLEFSE